MAASSDIKAKIKAKLDALKVAGTLKTVIEYDGKKGIFDYDFASTPAAVLGSPSMSSAIETNRDNMRAYTFEIVVITKAEEVSSLTQLEDLAETLLDAFDNDPTMTGSANGGVEPSTSPAEPVVSRGNNYLAFSVVVVARAVKVLSY